MRKTGNVSEFTAERDEEILKIFREELAKARVINLKEIYSKVANTPVKRFYVSELRAFEVLRHYRLHGEWLPKSRLRLEMFTEIDRRVRSLMEVEGIGLRDAVERVVNSSAPRFYITPRSCRTLLYELIKIRRYERAGLQ